MKEGRGGSEVGWEGGGRGMTGGRYRVGGIKGGRGGRERWNSVGVR